MKSSSGDGCMSSPGKRVAVSSTGESSRQPQMMIGGDQRAKNEALAYINAVKDMFLDKREKYDDFLEIMKDFKAQRIDTTGVMARVKELFKGHTCLILGFNTFLPKGYEIRLPLEDEQPHQQEPVELLEGINFVAKMKSHFQGNCRVYKSFINILKMYRKGTKSITEVYHEVAALLQDHEDLLQEFTHFFPNISKTASTHYDSAQSSVLRDRNFAMPTREKSIASHSDYDLSADQSDPELDRCLMKADKDQGRYGSKKKNCREERDRRQQERDHRDYDHDGSGEHLSHNRTSCRAEDSGVEPLHDTDENFGMHPISFACEDISSLKCMCNLVLHYLEKVKEKLRNPEDFQELLKYLHVYSKEIITRQELQSLVGNLLGKYADLMDGFDELLAQCEKNEGLFAGIMNEKIFRHEGHGPKPPIKVEESDRDCDTDSEIKSRDCKCLERDKSNATANKDVSVHMMSPYASKNKYDMKPISELNLANCEQCTPSYRLVPKNYPIALASHRTELDAEVLNDRWVSVPSGSDEYAFKHRCKNQYEENLFICEDYRIELDLLLESVKVTTKRVEELLEKINAYRIKGYSPIRIEEHLTAPNIRLIEKIYDDNGLDVINMIKKNASLALPIILNRLKQKQDDWARNSDDFNEFWAEIYAKNHHKSLDQRNVYSKQLDTKGLSPIALLKEATEIRERKQKENDDLLAIGAGNGQPIIPQLESVYHIEIYEDGPKDTEDVIKGKNNSAKSGTATTKGHGGPGVGSSMTNPMNLNTNRYGNKSFPLTESNSRKQWQTNEDNKVEEDDYVNSDCSAHKTETFGSNTQQGKMHINASIPDEASRAKKHDYSFERLVNANISLSSGMEQSNRRTNVDNASEKLLRSAFAPQMLGWKLW